MKKFYCIFVLLVCGTFLSIQSARYRVPIVFHRNYDISCYGVEKLHSFDSKKYGKVVEHLQKNCNIMPIQLHEPRKISDEQLASIHTRSYLNSLQSSSTIAQIVGIPPVSLVPNSVLQRYLLDSMKYATGGTLLGAQLALKHGWAINLSGGYHHAKAHEDGGFCVYADIPLAIKHLRKKKPKLKVLVVDLDAHQGNGHEDILKNDKRSFVFDMYSDQNYPYDLKVRKYIDFNFPLASNMGDKEYLKILKRELPKAVEKVKPHLIIYNAGTDILSMDPIGKLSISPRGVIERDAFVFSCAKEKKIPILMVLSGGYSSESAGVIGRSIENIIKKVLHVNLGAKFEILKPSLLHSLGVTLKDTIVNSLP